MNFGHFLDKTGFFGNNKKQEKYFLEGKHYGKNRYQKKLKEKALFQSAFDLFINKGFAKTTISDIAEKAELAKGTFYLYFKDKYDLRDKLIVHKAEQLFSDAHQVLLENHVEGFENQLLFMTDFIIERFKKITVFYSSSPRIYLGVFLKTPLKILMRKTL